MVMSERERRKCLEVLGLPHSSSDDDIKKAYRRLALQCHPDKNTGDGAKEQFQEISYAYKYLIEGPEAVGAEAQDEGIPFEVLLRLFPWMFGGFHRYHSGFNNFHDPFFPEFYDVYEDSDDSYDEDYYYYRSQPRQSSTYMPGPTKEEKKKEKKKKAKERRKAAKISKPQASPKPKKETPPSQQTSATSASNTAASSNTKSQQTSATSASNTAASSNTKSGCASHSDDIKFPDLKQTSSPHPTAESIIPPTRSHDRSRAPVGSASNSTQNKKSKKKLKQEQKIREKEMESIAIEFKKKQQQKAEKEARREAARKQKKERETTLQTQEAEGSIADTDSVITGFDDSESVRTDLDIEDEAARAEVISGEDTDDEEEDKVDYENVDDEDLEIDAKEDVPKGDKAEDSVHDQPTTNQKSGSVQSSASGPIPDEGHQSRQGHKNRYRDYRSPSHESEASGTSVTSDRQRQTWKKMKRNGRQKEADWEDWNNGEAENSSPYDCLMPQNEAEEMRMINEAILMSEREARQQGVIPQTQEEERNMLEAALRESEITAHWHGNINTLDDVSDGEDNICGVSAFTGDSAGSLGDWHESVGNNTSFLKQNKENGKSRYQFEASKINSGNGNIKLGDPSSGSSNSSIPKESGVQSSLGGYVKGKRDLSVNESLENRFDHTGSGKVKGPSWKTKESRKKKGDNSWEFGGAESTKTVFKADNVEGLTFGLGEDLTFVNENDNFETLHMSEPKGHIPSNMSTGCNEVSASKKYQNMSDSGNKTKDVQSQIRSHILAQLNHPKASSSNGLLFESKNIPDSQYSPVAANKESQQGSSPTGSNGNVSSAQNHLSVLHDMDDIDDVDTFGESSATAFSLSNETASSFDLDIPAALCNKERIKSYYQRKK